MRAKVYILTVAFKKCLLITKSDYFLIEKNKAEIELKKKKLHRSKTSSYSQMSPTLKERGLRRVRISGVGNSGCNSAFCLSYLAKNDKNPPTSPYWRSRSGVTFLILQRGKIRLWEVRDLAIATELIHRGCRFDPWVGKFPWRRKWQPTLVFFAQKIPWTE